VGLRGWLKRLERGAREDLESFELLDGTTYYFDRLETYKELFLHAYDCNWAGAISGPNRRRSTARCARLDECCEVFMPTTP
jgi:hypothetical protein